MCRAIFRLANTEYYDQAMMLAAANTLLGKGADGDGSIAAAMRHSRWHHVEKNAKVCGCVRACLSLFRSLSPPSFFGRSLSLP